MKPLKWGETPWNKLSRDELLREVQRMASALNSAHHVLRQFSSFQPDSPFWVAGSGYAAMEKTRQALVRMKQYEDDDVYHSFFRYADDLLFERKPGDHIGFGWMVCPDCNVMYGEGTDGYVFDLRGACKLTCRRPLRPLAWDDMKPAEDTDANL